MGQYPSLESVFLFFPSRRKVSLSSRGISGGSKGGMKVGGEKEVSPNMRHNPNSLKGVIWGSIVTDIKGDTRSLDYSSYSRIYNRDPLAHLA